MTIRVLIIDDSATMRAILMSRLSKEGDISVIATASNAQEGRELIKQFDPDVVTLDVEMPGMNGLDFLEKIMKLRPTPVIVVSGATQEGNEITLAWPQPQPSCIVQPQRSRPVGQGIGHCRRRRAGWSSGRIEPRVDHHVCGRVRRALNCHASMGAGNRGCE